MNTIIRDIGEFIFTENIPEKADAIMVVGGSHPELGEKAAELWKNGYAPYVFIGGWRSGNVTNITNQKR